MRGKPVNRRKIGSNAALWSALAGLVALAFAMAGAAEAQVACESLKGYSAPEVKVTAAASVTTPVPLCKLDGVIGKEINFTIWLPDAWNGKFVMGGQGGFAGRVDSQAMGMNTLQRGYAIAGTDTGHSGPAGVTDGGWAMGDPAYRWRCTTPLRTSGWTPTHWQRSSGRPRPTAPTSPTMSIPAPGTSSWTQS